MYEWVQNTIDSDVKKGFPVLSFPAIQKLNISVKDFISDPELQAKGMKVVADSTDASASVSLMDLSLEAECFGSEIRFSDEEVPTVIGSIVDTEEDADALQIPEVGSGRTQIYLDAMKKAMELITDRPVFAGTIGPFSLAGRLMDVTNAMVYCYDEPDMVHTVLEKATTFIINLINGYKETGCNGVVVAEPLAGLLSPSLAEEFSADYMKKIVDAVQDENFVVCYHNCGNTTIQTIDSILSINAKMLHFGNAIDMAEMVKLVPEDIIVMGNVDPAGQFRNGTPESVKAATIDCMKACAYKKNFVISSGCDIPPMSSWDNIQAFFDGVNEFYAS